MLRSQNGYWEHDPLPWRRSRCQYVSVTTKILLFFYLLIMHLSVWDSKPAVPGSPINWVELKTSQDIRGQGDMDAFHRKLMKFWIQSFLLGVPKIVVGFRTRDGILSEVKEIETHKIPETVNAGPNPQWNADMCVNFAAAFLDCKFPP